MGRSDISRSGFAALSPVRQLLRAVDVFAGRTAVAAEGETYTYAELGERVERLAGVLRARGVGVGDRVALVLENTPHMLEALYACAGMEAVSVPVNFRLSEAELETIFEHSRPTVVIADPAFLATVDGALAAAEWEPTILVADRDGYEGELAAATPVPPRPPADEMTLLSINYTSGTTGKPKGVMYTHRGATLHSLGVIAEARLGPESTYLWTLPMFHCHGWAFTWAVTAVGARHVCLRRPDPVAAWRLVEEEKVTHLCGAPTVILGLLGDPGAIEREIDVFVGGAPPSPSVLARCEALGWNVTHLYGLTETYGPQVVCEWLPEWDELPDAERARRKARQGVATVVSIPLRVVDENGVDVPRDGETLGEVLLTGNNVTTGYYRDPEATAAAFLDGWFRSGDLAVHHPDGYIELRDRKKDIVITGGENVSTIEVEAAIAEDPGVAEVAIVGVPDERWGERLHAFVVAREGEEVTLERLQEIVGASLARYKVPRGVDLVDELPKTATGKIQKFALRERIASSGQVGR
ncbi:MAG: AMP-binding protein [Solirubrobacterales bacterium]